MQTADLTAAYAHILTVSLSSQVSLRPGGESRSLSLPTLLTYLTTVDRFEIRVLWSKYLKKTVKPPEKRGLL